MQKLKTVGAVHTHTHTHTHNTFTECKVYLRKTKERGRN